MARKIICAAVLLSMAVLAVNGFSDADVGECSVNNGVPSFNASFVCGLSFYTAYTSGRYVEDITCQISKFDCNDNGTLTHTIITLIKGVEQPVEVHLLTDKGNGILQRVVPASYGTGTTTLKEVVMSWGEKKYNRFILGTFTCNEKSNDDEKSMRNIMITNPDVSLIDEAKQMKKALPFPDFYSLPFACQKDAFFPPTPSPDY